MHTSILRGSDFEMFVNGCQKDHADFFREWTNTRRLGFVSPRRVDGIGAVNLIMAHVTAFYDTYRATNEDFFAYPDFFAFQSGNPLASYSMLDLHPEHKSVSVSDDADERLDAINDRGVNVLIVPDGTNTDSDYHRIQMASARRNIDTCYVYSFDGRVKDADLMIRCPKEPLFDEYVRWISKVFDSPELAKDAKVQQLQSEWMFWQNGKTFVEQSFRRVRLEEALRLL